MQLSEEQNAAIEIIMKNIIKSGVGDVPSFRVKPFVYKVGGFAGTGKTHLLSETGMKLILLNQK